MPGHFYVLQTLTGDEQRFISLAQENLQRQQRTAVRLWWPRRRLTIRRRGRRVSSLAPLFPGYVVTEAAGIDQDLLRLFRRTSGFVRFLRDNTDIRPLEGPDLELVRHFLSFGEVIDRSRVSFDVNNRIVVQEGPLKGLEGRIVKVDRRKGRAKVKLDMYENSFTIDLGFEVMAPETAS